MCHALQVSESGYYCWRKRLKSSREQYRDVLKFKIQKKFVVTTDSNHNELISENLLNRKFNPTEPNTVIAGDITYLRVSSHWVYLSIFMDLYSRKIVGWDLSESLAAESTCNAFKKYLFKYGAEKDLMVHSDRVIQYASKDFRKLLASVKANQSMSREPVNKSE